MKIKDIHLLGFYVIKPRNPAMTHRKGYITVILQIRSISSMTNGLSLPKVLPQRIDSLLALS